jgi:ketosteroid isomerase-like protein
VRNGRQSLRPKFCFSCSGVKFRILAVCPSAGWHDVSLFVFVFQDHTSHKIQTGFNKTQKPDPKICTQSFRKTVVTHTTMIDSITNAEEEEKDKVRTVLEEWAAATRQNRRNDILQHHSANLVIFDVLPPMKYESAESYQQSWDEWQPDTQHDDATVFDLENLTITAGIGDIAFAHCFIRCGDTLPDGSTFQDLVRATFCLQKIEGSWRVEHQHVSKPHYQQQQKQQQS